MKKYLLFLVAALLATVARAADGDIFEYEGLNYKVLSEADHTAEVTDGNDVSGDVIIPYFVTKDNIRYVVTTIGDNAFKDCSSLTSITIPDSVTAIGAQAFSSCYNLATVTFGNSVVSIKRNAFFNCTSLTSIAFPDSLTSIGYKAFGSCTYLMTVIIPDSVTSIGDYAFSYCRHLKSILIPNSVISIGASAFYCCDLAMTSVTIPRSVTTIGNEAFNKCDSLLEINVEDGNEYYVSEDGILYDIAKTTLIQCPGAKTEFVIPNSVTSVCRKAIYDCYDLKSAIIGNSVISIGGSAFFNCSKLEKIINLNPTPPTIDSTDRFYGVSSDVVIYVPKGSKEAYMTAKGWSIFMDFREMGTFNVTLSVDALELSKGESTVITASIVKDEDMAVESTEWSSSDPDVATVIDGVVTATAPGTAVITYTAYDGYGVGHTAICTITVPGDSAVEIIAAEQVQGLVDVYTMQGLPVLRNSSSFDIDALPAGVCIVRHGNTVKKIAVR